jgi:UPF0755 protein
VIGLLVVLPLVVLGSGAAWFWWQVGACGGGGKPVEVQIERGWGVPKIAEELHHQHLIGNSLVFSVYARLNGDTRFEAGTYEMKKNMCVRDAVRTLKAGPRIDYAKLTIPPGLWMKEIAQRIGKLPGRSADAVMEASENNAVRSVFEPDDVHNLEGLLWPDTYKIAAEEDEIDVVKTMADTFDKRAAALGLGFANVNGYGPYDVLKVASLIESEAKLDVDRPLIASVIYNRLARGMPLQVDATLIYARGNPNNRKLTDADKAINSPYNTYTHTGLPPTPIAGVSAASLEAAIHPAQTDYLYYVVIDKTGKHAFASTLLQHEQNIEIARRNGVL